MRLLTVVDIAVYCRMQPSSAFGSVRENRKLYYKRGWLGSRVVSRLACWTQAQKGLGPNRSRDAVA